MDDVEVEAAEESIEGAKPAEEHPDAPELADSVHVGRMPVVGTVAEGHPVDVPELTGPVQGSFASPHSPISLTELIGDMPVEFGVDNS